MRGRRHKAAALLGLLVALPLGAQQPGPPSTGGVARLDFLLQHLAETRRVLLIGAHPDDEDTYLLTWASRHFGAEAAYLSLTRGEGGQNLIGDELGVGLGLLRTRELEAARAVDGGHQFFTRAIDFGYTRSLEETRRFWPVDSILKDVVRVIRRFRPHVIVPVFDPRSRGGHGQHQYSAVIAQQAYEVAGDPARFPELITEEGLQPWTPLKLFRARASNDEATLTIETGVMDHRVGKTIRQIALASRSQHRSQDFGVTQPIGPMEIRLALMHDRVGGGSGALFAGVPLEDTWLTDLADSLRRHLAPAMMPAVAARLAEAVSRLPAEAEREYRLLAEALAIASGALVDVRTEHPVVVRGAGLPVTVEVAARDVHAEIPAECEGCTATATNPYFLTAPPGVAMYDWRAAPPALRGRPFAGPVVRPVQLPVPLARRPVPVEVTVRTRDQVLGEIREPVRVVPRLGVELTPDLVIWPADDASPRAMTVTLVNYGGDSVAGSVALEAQGWSLPAAQPFRLAPGARGTVTFSVRRPGTTRGAVTVRAVATVGAERFRETVRLVSYPHIRPVQYLTTAEAAVQVAPITLPRVQRVGYVRGAADRIPEVLERVGLPLTLLREADLAAGDLSAFDVIVVGPRAYESDSAVVRDNARLLDYVRRGGTLIVQYQQYEFSGSALAPYAIEISRPHDRITDETAPVRILDPRHPAFTTPHQITDADWADWPQERGLYFGGTWAGEYTPLLEMQDPDMDPIRGGLLVAPYGEGTYVYTGMSFFRAIPAGNPGALRLLLNLIALGTTE